MNIPTYLIAAPKKSDFIGLANMNIEIADGRNLLPVFSFSVEATKSVLGKWPNLQPQIIEILWSQPWLALELRRLGDGVFTHSNNPATVVVIGIGLDQVRDEIAKLLEEAGFAYIAVEIGRGVVFNGADKDPIELHDRAYTLEASPGSSGALPKAQGQSVVLSG